MNHSTHLIDSAVYRFASFEFQPKEHRLVSDNQEISLGARTLELLELLVENAGRLVTKEEIFKSLWPQVVVEENNLHVHISMLRKLLGASAIVTVSGKGYRFAATVTKVNSDFNLAIDLNLNGMSVLIVDDHTLIRDALKSVVCDLVSEANIYEASTMGEACALLKANSKVEMIILDLLLPDTSGIDFLVALRREYPHISVVVVSADSEKSSVKAAMGSGAQGYIPKSTSRSVMSHAFKLIFSGGSYIPSEAITTWRN